VAIIIDGKKIADEILRQTARKVQALQKKKIQPKLVIVLVGQDRASRIYARRKLLAAEKVGLLCEIIKFSDDISERELTDEIKKIQKNNKPHGLIIQLPLPEHLYTRAVLNSIDPSVDVDCLTEASLGRLVAGTNFIVPPAPGAALTALAEIGVNPQGKDVTIVGTGVLVGKPLAIALINAGASVTTCNTHTSGNEKKCRAADIIITGVGKKNLIRGKMIKKGAIVIDTGFSFEKGKMYGDVNFAEAAKIAGYLTPTPGGIGPITVARLLLNTVICAGRGVNKRP
jgi:methylenetetrahydrofolate dehydrogenase (NADP+) / methenyltetrahydrofolate cyclohydrolase